MKFSRLVLLSAFMVSPVLGSETDTTLLASGAPRAHPVATAASLDEGGAAVSLRPQPHPALSFATPSAPRPDLLAVRDQTGGAMASMPYGAVVQVWVHRDPTTGELIFSRMPPPHLNNFGPYGTRVGFPRSGFHAAIEWMANHLPPNLRSDRYNLTRPPLSPTALQAGVDLLAGIRANTGFLSTYSNGQLGPSVINPLLPILVVAHQLRSHSFNLPGAQSILGAGRTVRVGGATPPVTLYGILESLSHMTCTVEVHLEQDTFVGYVGGLTLILRDSEIQWLMSILDYHLRVERPYMIAAAEAERLRATAAAASQTWPPPQPPMHLATVPPPHTSDLVPPTFRGPPPPYPQTDAGSAADSVSSPSASVIATPRGAVSSPSEGSASSRVEASRPLPGPWPSPRTPIGAIPTHLRGHPHLPLPPPPPIHNVPDTYTGNGTHTALPPPLAASSSAVTEVQEGM